MKSGKRWRGGKQSVSVRRVRAKYDVSSVLVLHKR